jgi:hypothetical protein
MANIGPDLPQEIIERVCTTCQHLFRDHEVVSNTETSEGRWTVMHGRCALCSCVQAGYPLEEGAGINYTIQEADSKRRLDEEKRTMERVEQEAATQKKADEPTARFESEWPGSEDHKSRR